MARIGRPRVSEEPSTNRNVRIDDKTWKRVQRAASEDKTSSSAVVRRAVVEHLDRREAERGG